MFLGQDATRRGKHASTSSGQGPRTAAEGRNEDSDHTSEGGGGDASYARMNEGAMNGEQLQRADFASRGQPTFRHSTIVERDCIAVSGNLGRHAADDEVLTLDDEDQGRSPLDRREVRKGERDRDQGSRFESQSHLTSHAVPDVVLRVPPKLLQCLFGSPQERTEFVSQNLLHIGLLAKDEGVPRFEKHEVRVPSEPVPLANFFRDHNLALAGHFHDVHRLVRRVLLLKSCLG